MTSIDRIASLQGDITEILWTLGLQDRIAVVDTGCGIPAEHLPHIFDRYWHARRQSRTVGTGLGLAIARGIVEAHGGRITVESALGLGTSFIFTVPTADTARPAAQPSGTRGAVSEPPRRA